MFELQKLLKGCAKRTTLRSLLCVSVVLGLLWAANAQALPADYAHHRRSESRDRNLGDVNIIARRALTNVSDLFQITESDERATSRRGRRLAYGRGRGHGIPSIRHQIEIVRVHLGSHGRISTSRDFGTVERIEIRHRYRPTHPIPEPNAALVFMVGIGLAAVRLRRSS
jgi:hypothetical protein